MMHSKVWEYNMTHKLRSILNKNRKFRLFLGALLLIQCVCTGCGQNAAASTAEVIETESESGDEEIVIWAWDDTFNIKAANMAAEEYQTIYPDAEFQIVTKEREEILVDVQNMLSTQSYDQLPDIIMIEDYDIQEILSLYMSEFVELTNRIDYKKYADYKSELCSRGDHYYGIPFDSGTAALFYRVDILNEAGYTEEDMQDLTWDTFIEIGQQVYEKTGKAMITLDPTDFPIVRLIMQSCGKWYVKEDGQTVDIMENDALRQALTIYNRLLKTNVGKSVNGWNEFISEFQNGDVAGVLSGCWITSTIKEDEEQSGLWRITNIPIVSNVEGATNASNVGGSSWYILKHGAHAEEAADFLVEMFGENTEFINTLIDEIGLIPAVKDASAYSNTDNNDNFFGGQQAAKILSDLTGEIPAVNYGSRTYEIENIVEDEFQNALLDNNLLQCLQRIEVKAQAVTKN